MLKLDDAVPTTIDGYLRDLRRRLEAELPQERVDDLVAETESHLREREAALREMEAGEPELDAVRGFVAASSQATELVASDAADRWALQARRVRIPLFWLVSTLPLVGIVIAPMTQQVHPWVVHLPLGLMTLAIVSFVSRLPDSRRLRTISLGIAVAVGILFSPPLAELMDLGGQGSHRRSLRAEAADWGRVARWQEEQLANASDELRAWTARGSRPNEFPKLAGAYVTPAPSPGFVTYTRPHGEARRARETKGQSWLSLMKARAEEYRANHRNYAAAANAPGDFTVGILWFAWLLFAGFLAVLTDFGFSRLGAKLHQRRRSRVQRR